MSPIIYDDTKKVIENLGELVNDFSGKKILITGYKGFLGANFTALFHILNSEILDQKAIVYCMDNDIVDLDNQVNNLTNAFVLLKGSGVKDLPINDFNYIIHCAGIASPIFYRKFPLETINVNAIGYWELLNGINYQSLDGFLYFSTSEIYGDPDKNNIPTNEEYRGNVSCTGPRACYDESKRLGETISVSFVNQKKLPIKIVRPFNVYGPFMRINDRRVIPDFVKYAIEQGKIRIFSDGTPTRAFCYVSDAIIGFTRALLLGREGLSYNIGNDSSEISMSELAELISEIIGNVEIVQDKSSDKHYLTDNPQRRCPDIQRAREELGYYPEVPIKKGLERIISWYKEIYY